MPKNIVKRSFIGINHRFPVNSGVDFSDVEIAKI